MKKILLFLFVFAFTNAVTAQIFEEDFATLDGWTLLDRDGDGNNWEIITVNPAGPVGASVASSASWVQAGALTPNNVMISPEIDLTNESGTVLVDWYAYAQDQTWSAEHYKVVLTTDPTSAGVEAGEIIYEDEVGSNGAYVKYTGNMSNFVGQKVYIAFVHYMVSDQFRLNIDGVSVYTSNTKDVAVTALTSPDNANGCRLSDSENITVTLTNLGGQAITDFEVSYSLNGGTPVAEMVTESIAPASSYDYTFSNAVDLSALGSYSLEVSTNLDGDTDTSNDSQTFGVASTDAVFTIHMMTDASSGQQWELVDNATGDVVATNLDGYQWNIEVTEDICIYSDKCYTFRYAGAMTAAGTYLELLVDGNRIAGDTDGNGVPASIDIPAIGSACPQDNMGLRFIANNTYEPVDVATGVSFSARNMGGNDVTSFEASYSIDGGTPVSQTFTQTLTSGEIATFTFDTPFTLTDLKESDLAVSITKVNTADDPDPSNNSLNQPLVALSQVPPRSVLIEEGTGTWCIWCPRGAVGVEYMSDTYADAITIAVHNGSANAPDPMDFGDYDSDLIQQVNGTGYPFSGIDRTIETDPSAADLELAYQVFKTINAPVGINVDAKYTGNGNVTVDVSADVYAAVLNGDYRFSVVLTEDGLSGTTDDWAQANIYSGGQFGAMGGYENLPNPVPADQMVYNHVARQILGGFSGMANSFPATASAGDKPTFSFNATLDAENDFTNMHAVAMLINNANGTVLNSASTSIENVSSTDDVFDHNIARVFPNPFSSTANIELGLEGTQHVEMTVLNSLGQRVAQRDYGMLTGKTILPFNGDNLQNGFYYFHIKVDDKLVTKKVMLNK